MSVRSQQVWAGAAMVGLAAWLEVVEGGGWSVAVLAMAGILTLLMSYSPEVKR